MTVIHINASREYDVKIERGLLDSVGRDIADVLPRARTAAIVTDGNVAPLYADRVQKSLEDAGLRVIRHIFPAGEQSKTLATYGEILNSLCAEHMTRGDVVVALGGGVTGDMAGFAAATYQRGIAYVQVPTTLLAAVDSSVGGKTAIDLPAGKNQVGAFWQPALVLCDPDTFATLPQSEWRCGCGEIIKYAVLYSGEMFAALNKTPVREQTERIIAECVELKRRAVAQDEYDTGARQQLNLGHTFGHAAEACSGYTIPHGCAVAIGMAMMTRAAVRRGICPPETLTSLLALLEKYDLPTACDYPLEAMYAAIATDKKISAGMISLIVPEKIGRCRTVTVPTGDVREWLRDGGAR